MIFIPTSATKLMKTQHPKDAYLSPVQLIELTHLSPVRSVELFTASPALTEAVGYGLSGTALSKSLRVPNCASKCCKSHVQI